MGLISGILRLFTLAHLVNRLVEVFDGPVPLLLLRPLCLMLRFLLNRFLFMSSDLVTSLGFRDVMGMSASRLLV